MYDTFVKSAADYMVDLRNASDFDIQQRMFMIKNVADHVAVHVGYETFAKLDEKPNALACAQAMMYTRERFEGIDADETPGFHAAFAVAHLMSVHLLRGLSEDPFLEQLAKTAMQIYDLAQNSN